MREDLLGVYGIQFDLGDFTHLDPIEPHFPALAQPVHGPLEDDVILLEVTVQVELGQPDAKGEKAHKKNKGEQSHEGVVGVFFH